MERPFELIKEKLGRQEILAQLQEEAAELSVAASKLRRSLEEGSGSPITTGQALNMIMEEVADVSVCLRALKLDAPLNRLTVYRIMDEKAKRWADRLGIPREDCDG